MSKILIVLQGSQFDQPAAIALAKLVADMEPEMSTISDVMIAQTRSAPILRETVNYMARKFRQVHTFNSDRTDVGHPSSCNALFFNTMDRIYMGVMREGWDYDAIYFAEPDIAPLRRGWIKEIYDEFKASGKLLGGFLYTEKCHFYPHINGSLVISPLIRQKHKDFFWSDPRLGWDCYHGKMLVAEGYSSRLFWMDYARQTIDEETLFAPKKYAKHHPLAKKKISPCIFHGVKDSSARQAVRNRLGLVA